MSLFFDFHLFCRHWTTKQRIICIMDGTQKSNRPESCRLPLIRACGCEHRFQPSGKIHNEEHTGIKFISFFGKHFFFFLYFRIGREITDSLPEKISQYYTETEDWWHTSCEIGAQVGKRFFRPVENLQYWRCNRSHCGAYAI